MLSSSPVALAALRRAKANALREDASQVSDPSARQGFLNIADTYDELASNLENTDPMDYRPVVNLDLRPERDAWQRPAPPSDYPGEQLLCALLRQARTFREGSNFVAAALVRRTAVRFTVAATTAVGGWFGGSDGAATLELPAHPPRNFFASSCLRRRSSPSARRRAIFSGSIWP